MKCSTLYETIKDYDQALAACNLSIGLNPLSAKTFNMLGNIQYAKQDYSSAISDYSAAIYFADKPYAVYYYNRGVAYKNKENISMAIADFNTATLLDATNVDYIINRAEAYVSNGNYESAFRDYEKAMAIDEDNDEAKNGLVEARNSRAKSFLGEGEFQSAVADYEEALKVDPDDDDANKGLVQAQRLLTRAEVEICNESSESVNVAIVADKTVSDDTNLSVDGWFEVHAEKCENFGFFPRQKPLYMYARQGTRHWGGRGHGLNVCIKDQVFHRSYGGSKYTCPPEELVNFLKVVINESEAKHSVTLGK